MSLTDSSESLSVIAIFKGQDTSEANKKIIKKTVITTAVITLRESLVLAARHVKPSRLYLSDRKLRKRP